MFAWLPKIKTPPLDPTQHPYATATTPDEIIAEAMKVSMAKDITGWKKETAYKGDYSRYPTYTLSNRDGTLRLTWKTRPSGYAYETYGFEVNEIEFDPITAEKVIASYDRLKQAYDKAQTTALKAKLAMQANENKWNLAESLLGMKRNEFGALVPAE